MVLFGYGKESIRELKAEIDALKREIEITNDRIKSLKGYVYAKKIRLPDPDEQTEQETHKDLNTGFPLRPL